MLKRSQVAFYNASNSGDNWCSSIIVKTFVWQSEEPDLNPLPSYIKDFESGIHGFPAWASERKTLCEKKTERVLILFLGGCFTGYFHFLRQACDGL